MYHQFCYVRPYLRTHNAELSSRMQALSHWLTGTAGKLEPGDQVIFGAPGYLPAAVGLLVADVGGGPAGELQPERLQRGRGE